MLREELLALGLDAATVGRILTANHRPMDVTRRLALAAQAGLKAEMENDQGAPEHALERSVIRANQNQNFDGGFCTLANLLGACEKINKTPIPLVYTRHAERFLLLWLLAVPPTLCSAFGGGVGLLSGAGVVFGTGLISILLFGVDELAIQVFNERSTRSSVVGRSSATPAHAVCCWGASRRRARAWGAAAKRVWGRGGEGWSRSRAPARSAPQPAA